MQLDVWGHTLTKVRRDSLSCRRNVPNYIKNNASKLNGGTVFI